MVIAPPPATELNTVTALLAVIADPKRSAEALAGIKAASDEYRALAAQAAEDRAAADAKLAEVNEALTAQAKALETLARERVEVNGKIAKADADRRAADAGLASLDEQLADFAAKVHAFDEQSAKREAALTFRENEVFAREAKADALIAEYTEKLAKLKSIAG
jgi:septal ring factor EnvC (AmiA/AmiB activator)